MTGSAARARASTIAWRSAAWVMATSSRMDWVLR
jgi:hypothetical protein